MIKTKIWRTETEGALCSLLICGALAASVVATLVLPSVVARPSYVECTSNSECDRGYCCVLGMYRYSVPTCQRQRSEGQLCRKDSETAHNVSVAYPNGDVVRLTDVHQIFCACSEGLLCDRKSSTCIDGGETSS